MYLKKSLLFSLLIVLMFGLLSGCTAKRINPWTAEELRSEFIGFEFFGTESGRSDVTKGGGVYKLTVHDVPFDLKTLVISDNWIQPYWSTAPKKPAPYLIPYQVPLTFDNELNPVIDWSRKDRIRKFTYRNGGWQGLMTNVQYQSNIYLKKKKPDND